jgi:hypothetical protein
MKRAAIAMLMVTWLPLQAQAQPTELALNCKFESVVDLEGGNTR